MRKYGEYLGVNYRLLKYSLRHLAYEYSVSSDDGFISERLPNFIYVDNTKQLKQAIREILGYEES